MKIISIEPTPSPNTMKIILNEEIPMGKSTNYKKENKEKAPAVISEILEIDGIKGVYHVADFLAVERNAKYDWQELLLKVRQSFGEESEPFEESEAKLNEHFGEVNVFVQMFKDIPMQIKLSDGTIEKRFGLQEEFLKAVARAELPGDNVVLMRKWKDFGIRYGDMDQVGEDLKEELSAAYTQDRLNTLVNKALAEEDRTIDKATKRKKKVTTDDLNHSDWRVRYHMLEQMDEPTIEDIPLLEMALNDEKPSIRRLATVYVGMIKDKAVLPLLYKALKDKTVTVRRTAGDCLSDLGFAEASGKMAEALKDESKLVRWRAAMFLFEEGDESTLPALKNAQEDSEFEVKMQIKMAIERIEGGEEAKGSVWKQMTDATRTSLD